MCSKSILRYDQTSVGELYDNVNADSTQGEVIRVVFFIS